MANVVQGLGVQSYCFRAFPDNSRVAEMVQQCGLDAIELCRAHVNFDDPAQHRPAIQTYADAGIRIVSMGVQTFGPHPNHERPWFEFAQEAGAAFISADFEPSTYQEALDRSARLCDEYGVKIAIHNHGGRHWLGSSTMLRHILSIADSSIGLCLDTAWCLDAGEDPLAWTDAFGDRLYGLHLKDFVFDRARKHQDVVVGTGNLDLPALLGKLNEVNFQGFTVLEYEGDVNNPVPALTQCVQQIRAASSS